MEEQTACQCGGAEDLFEAATWGCSACCYKFLDQVGKTRDGKEYGGWSPQNQETALMVAAVLGNAGCVWILLDREAWMRDAKGWTALMRAAYMGRLECVEHLALLENGMKETVDGNTALMIAASRGKFECVKILASLEKGMKDNSG